MSNSKTVWAIERHTLAKHRILREYLKAWFPILSHQSAKLHGTSNVIRYIEGFAGPGIYTGGEPGSPIIALKVVNEHTHKLPTPVAFDFVELDKARHARLEQEIQSLAKQASGRRHVASVGAHQDDCRVVIPGLIEKYRKSGFGPAMFFLDQFGYSGIPIELVSLILSLGECEIFSYFNWDHLNRFIMDENKSAGLSAAFGSEDWRQCVGEPPERRVKVFLDLYKAALREKGLAKYVLHFAMHDENDKLLNWLFFCTNHLDGVEEMKRAMEKVDSTGACRFSERLADGQLAFLAEMDDAWLANELEARLRGRSLTVEEIRKYVLVETPSRLHKKALAALEMSNRLHVPNPHPGRRIGTFGDGGMIVAFRPDPSKGASASQRDGIDGSLFENLK
ncbi:MAG: three-Cys-motif partner protein TcmP [Verrucomicrobiota bacterium]